MLRVYCWLLWLYPSSDRDDFGDEMASVFRDARSDLPPAPALTAKISFYRREFGGLLSGALSAHFDRLFGDRLSNLNFVFPASLCS